MDKLRVQGPTELQDEVTIFGAKNAALSILFTVLLAKEPVEIQSVPRLKDVDVSVKLLSQLGTEVKCNGSVHIDARDVNVFYVSYDLVKTMRASIQTLGLLVACFGQGQVSLPDGYTIGARPVDLHISGLEQLDTTIKLEEGCVKASVNGRLKGVYIVTDKINVGVTVTIMCAATLVEGTMIIENTAREPEVVNTANFLITLGAKTSGQGTDHIVIEGVKCLGSGVYRMLSDYIETGISLMAAAVSRDKTIYRGTQPDTPDAVLAKLCDTEADIEADEDWVSLGMHGKRPGAANTHTASRPVFPADTQAQLMLLNLMAEGAGFITETVFKNHFMHVPELSRMGMYAEIESNTVIRHGIERFSDAQVMTADLRAPASLVLVGYIVKGTMVADRIYYIDRGYERIEDKLRALGANIERVKGE